MTGRKVWWYFVAFFGLVIAVNVVMMTLAIRTHSGLVTDHPYEKGLAYNEVVYANERQEALGWKGEIDYKNGMLHFELRDKNNSIIMPKKMTATITRPTQPDMDFVVQLNTGVEPVTFPKNGLWHVRVDVVYEGRHFQKFKRIIVQ